MLNNRHRSSSRILTSSHLPGIRHLEDASGRAAGRSRQAAPSSSGTTPGGLESPLYLKSTLPNGVRVVTGPMSGVRSASLIFYYNVGSRFEPAPIAGVSHFLEHMLFKGTERRPDPMMISEEIEGVGGMVNAGDRARIDPYWFKVPSTHFGWRST